MFRSFFIFALFVTACGYVFASDGSYQPVWPEPGSEADVQFYGSDAVVGDDVGYYGEDFENVRVVSKIGADMVVENNFTLGSGAREDAGAWSGGADLTQMYQAPAGFNIYENQAEMPLMHSEMLEDDGGSVLSISRSDRKKTKRLELGGAYAAAGGEAGASSDFDTDFDVNEAGSFEKAVALQDQVRSWVVASGQTLRVVLQEWCDREGWDLIWNTTREYPVQASAVFKGRFMDVSSALVRNFSRAEPIPYAKFYKGNRVLVVTASEE